MTCTTSLVHQPGAEDLGCGLLFAPTAVLHIPSYGESCNFIEELKWRKLRTSEAKLKGWALWWIYTPHAWPLQNWTWDIGNPWTNVLLDHLRIYFHEILESIVHIDRLHVSFREEVLLGAAPSRHVAASASSKSWRPWWQPRFVHIRPSISFGMTGTRAVQFSTNKDM